ncbi:hypothetical protein DE146DRAFT_651511 [Phaeosphaeria sp. MPI-PUGE-AT-0046c]|nr:hypothetical protein DE146DRAFT_651511 [Phaeosphaeria sp. MPI-PUGE-AT-0046c]
MPTLPVTNMLQPDQNRLNSQLLQLPGELRNQIFSYCIFPFSGARPLTIVHGTKDRHFTTKVLSAGIFRVCHQLRLESLSFLAAVKHFNILGTKAACVFLECLGPAAADVKRITVAQPIVCDAPMSSRQINTFIDFLSKATSLQFLKLEVGRVGAPFTWNEENIGADWVFLERTVQFVKSRPDLDFRWRAGAYDLKATAGASPFARAAGVRELLGAENEDAIQHGLVYMW